MSDVSTVSRVTRFAPPRAERLLPSSTAAKGFAIEEEVEEEEEEEEVAEVVVVDEEKEVEEEEEEEEALDEEEGDPARGRFDATDDVEDDAPRAEIGGCGGGGTCGT